MTWLDLTLSHTHTHTTLKRQYDHGSGIIKVCFYPRKIDFFSSLSLFNKQNSTTTTTKIKIYIFDRPDSNTRPGRFFFGTNIFFFLFHDDDDNKQWRQMSEMVPNMNQTFIWIALNKHLYNNNSLSFSKYKWNFLLFFFWPHNQLTTTRGPNTGQKSR